MDLVVFEVAVVGDGIGKLVDAEAGFLFVLGGAGVGVVVGEVEATSHFFVFLF